MKRLRSMGLAAVTALCLAVVPSSALAAGGFVADSGYANLHGVPTTHTLTLKASGSETNCTAYGNTVLEKPSDYLAIGSETLNCYGGVPAESKLKMNGCELKLRPGSSSFDIGPPGCGPMEAVLNGNCAITIGAQTGLAATYENSGSGSSAVVNINLKATGATYTFPNSNICGSKGVHNDLSITTSGWSEGATGSGVYAYAGSLPNGLYLTESSESYLVAQLFPGIITGSLETTPATVFGAKSSAVTATCTGGTFSNELTAPAHTAVPLSASFSGCSFGALGTPTVTMNSCRYSVGEFKSTGSGYKGQAAISCSKAGDTITVAGSGCSVAIPAQALGSEAAEPKNVGQGVHATVSARLASSNVQYTATGPFCSLVGISTKGAQTDGIVDVRVNLSAVLSESVIKHG